MSHWSREYDMRGAPSPPAAPSTEGERTPVNNGSAAPARQEAPGSLPAVDVADVVCQFGRIRALDGVSLRVMPGTVVGVVGPNGAGKTTLIDVICGLVRPARGTAPDMGAHSVVAGGRPDRGAHHQLPRRGRGVVRPRRDPARRQAGRRGFAGGARSAHGPVPRAGVLGGGRDRALGRAADAPRGAAGRDRRLRSARVPGGRHDARGRRAGRPPGLRRGGLPHALAGPRRDLPLPHRGRHRAVSAWRLFRSSAELEAAHLLGNRGFVALTALAAVSFLAMVSLFGLTGSYAPVALIDRDGGPLARRFIEALDGAHHSFALTYMSEEAAETALGSGRLVGIITIPAGFSDAVAKGTTVPVDVRIDNVNVDLTNDMQRALPAAIVAFARRQQFPGTAVQMVEHDVWPHDTGYIPYLTVSALALDAMVIAGILGAMATAREWERRTVKLLRLSPASPGIVLAGKLSVAATVAAMALALALVVIEVGYGVVPIARWPTAFALLACVAIFTSVGAWLGALLKRTLAAVPLLFGLAMPFYVDSGALEPTRFDGDAIWALPHLPPVYYAVGVLEWAFHGLHVTSEPVWVDLLVLVVIAVVAVILTLGRLARGATR